MGLTEPPRSGFPVRLDASSRQAVAEHLLSLDADDRYSRFATPITDQGIAAYVGRIDFARDLCFATQREDRSLSGFIHLAVQGRVAELGASVAVEWRARGVARSLFRTALMHAGGQGIGEVHLATGHPVARRICQGLGYRVEGGFDYPRAKVWLDRDSTEEIPPGFCPVASWRPQVESNHQFALRRGVLYPFNYGGALEVRIVPRL